MNQEKFLERLFTKTNNYLKDIKDSGVVNYTSGSSLFKEIKADLSIGDQDEDKIFEEIDTYLKYALKTTHPQFNNQLNAGFVMPALAAEVISFITNTSMATYEIAPIGTILEQKLSQKLIELIGFKDGEGIMTTGGSNANMLAIQCARNTHSSQIKLKGNGEHKFHIYVSDQAHYSFQKSVNIMGLGFESLIKIKSNNGVMDSKTLESKIIESKKDGFIPLLIASTSGTTVLGSFDDINKNDEIAKKYNVWHHVDAAWGGPALFSDELKPLMSGVSKVDSLTWDAHKLMGTGLITSFIILKDRGQLESANNGGGGKYLFHDYENADYDTGPMSLQCGRKVDSLKLWLAWKYYGDNGYQKLIDGQLEKAKYLVEKVNEHPRLKLVADREFLNICFQVIPNKEVDIDMYNYKLRFHLVKKGESLVNFARFEDGTTFFRYVLTNYATQKRDIDIFLENLFDAEKTLNLG